MVLFFRLFREKALYVFFLDRRNSPNAPPLLPGCRPSLRLEEGGDTGLRDGDVDDAVGLCIDVTMVLEQLCYGSMQPHAAPIFSPFFIDLRDSLASLSVVHET